MDCALMRVADGAQMRWASALLLVSGVARAETRPSYGGVVHAALASTPVGLDPASLAPGDAEVTQLIYDAPFRLDSGRPRPHLALALENPEGALKARLRMRSDVRFHDGTALGAADVAASLTRALKLPGGWMLGPIRAARAVSEDTVELELARPAPDLPLLLATPAAVVLPGGALRPRPVGTGPFSVEKVDKQAVSLKANPACFAGRPHLDRLVLRAFASRTEEAGSYEIGALEASRHGASAFEGGAPKHATVVVDGPATLTLYLALGRGLPDAVARPLAAALALGIDRERLRRLHPGASVAAAGPVPPALGGALGRPPFDPARARALLPGPLKVGLVVDGSRFDDRAVADRLLAELARLGLDVSVEVVDAPVYAWRLENGRYDLLLGSSPPPVPDGGLAALALVAAVDPAAARAALARAPADPGAPSTTARVIPLVHRAARLHHTAELRGLVVDAAGRASWAEAYLGGSRRHEIP
jgi:peptide/nickel transport system substrate-binding protein